MKNIFSVLRLVRNFRLALVILLTMFATNAARASAITDEVKQRVQAELDGKCLKLFLDDTFSLLSCCNSYQRAATGFSSGGVFAIGEINSKKYCAWELRGVFRSWESAEKSAIAKCETLRPQGGSPCEVYAHNNDIVYVSIHERLKTATKLLESGDIPATERAFDEVKVRHLSPMTTKERGEYEYLFGKILINSKAEQNRADAIEHFNNSWSHYENVNGAVEEGNLRITEVDIDKDWQPIRDAYQYFLSHASDEQKKQHPEVEQNLKQTEPYYQADLAQKEEAAKEQARLGAIEAERKAKEQAILEEEKQKQAKVEAKRKAVEGDGSADDITCKSYGARMGTQEYINCRIQLRTKQTADEQQAAQIRAADEHRAAQADYNSRLEAARQAEQARRDAADQNRRESAALMAIGGALMRNSTPQQAPPRAPIQCYSLGNIIQCQ